MSSPPARRSRSLSDQLVIDVRDQLSAHLAQQRTVLARIAPEVAIMVDRLEGYLEGGKMLRPLFCFWGGMGLTEDEPPPSSMSGLARAGAAIELVQAAALLHDDVIDHSPDRRGRPAEHVAAARRHRDAGMVGSPEDFGEAFAIVLGDLALSWSEQLFAAVEGSEPLSRSRGRSEFDALRTEVMSGQYLDILHQAGGFGSAGSMEDAASAVIRWKTVPYTVSRPVRLGAALRGADDDLLDQLEEWAIVVGTAFQLRDDLLSVVGVPGTTGKPVGGDITEGKRTVILARALEAADPHQRSALDAAVGVGAADPSQVARAHEVLVDTGAVRSVITDVTRLSAQATEILGGITTLSEQGRSGLSQLAASATDVRDLPAS